MLCLLIFFYRVEDSNFICHFFGISGDVKVSRFTFIHFNFFVDSKFNKIDHKNQDATRGVIKVKNRVLKSLLFYSSMKNSFPFTFSEGYKK